MSLLRGLEQHADDPDFQAKWRAVKFEKKQQLADYIESVTGDKVPIDALFDIHVCSKPRLLLSISVWFVADIILFVTRRMKDVAESCLHMVS